MYHSAFNSKDLDDDEKMSIWYVSIWKAIMTDNGQSKFTTYLWNIFKRDCITYVRKKVNNSRIPDIVYEEYYTPPEDIEDILLPLNQRSRDILKYRFMYGCTLREIGERYSLTSERIRQIINESLRKLKCYVS